MWTMWTMARQSQGLRSYALGASLRGQCGPWPGKRKACVAWTKGVGFVDNVDMWTIDFKSLDPLWGAGCRRRCRQGCIPIQYIFLSLSRPKHSLSTLSTYPRFHWARTWTTPRQKRYPHITPTLSIPDCFVGVLHCAKNSLTLSHMATTPCNTRSATCRSISTQWTASSSTKLL